MEKSVKVAALFVATLKSIYVIHQQNHWLSKGNDFYGNHLLFERIYGVAKEDVDLAAEKFVGLFGSDCLDYDLQAKMSFDVLKKYSSEKDLLERSLKIETDFIKFCKDSYECFKDEDTLSLGLDDMIMSIASNHEGVVYLLKQAKGSEK